jgi:RNA polymerase sigma factor (sigma-70 family)
MDSRDRTVDGPGEQTGVVLFQQAQAGCRDSLERLMAAHEALVHTVVRRQALGCLSYSEAVQAGRIGLWRAILGFDPQHGLAFSTYAWPAIMHHIWREVKLAERRQAQAVEERPLEAIPPATWQLPDPVEQCEAQELCIAVRAMVTRLPGRLRTVVIARYGLDGQPPAIFPHIGVSLALTKERVRQLHVEALARLRHPAYSHRVRLFLGRHTLEDFEAAEADLQQVLRRRGGRDGR